MKLSPSAVKQLRQLLSAHPNQYMRVEIAAGGCSGFEKKFDLSVRECDDTLIDDLVVVDPISLELLANAELDYKTSLGGNLFVLEIPESTADCGCGKSFSI